MLTGKLRWAIVFILFLVSRAAFGGGPNDVELKDVPAVLKAADGAIPNAKWKSAEKGRRDRPTFDPKTGKEGRPQEYKIISVRGTDKNGRVVIVDVALDDNSTDASISFESVNEIPNPPRDAIIQRLKNTKIAIDHIEAHGKSAKEITTYYVFVLNGGGACFKVSADGSKIDFYPPQ